MYETHIADDGVLTVGTVCVIVDAGPLSGRRCKILASEQKRTDRDFETGAIRSAYVYWIDWQDRDQISEGREWYAERKHLVPIGSYDEWITTASERRRNAIPEEEPTAQEIAELFDPYKTNLSGVAEENKRRWEQHREQMGPNTWEQYIWHKKNIARPILFSQVEGIFIDEEWTDIPLSLLLNIESHMRDAAEQQ